jgi:hypothetical protein
MTAIQDITIGGNNNNGNNGNLLPSLIPLPSSSYFKLGSSTRRHSVIGCIGYEFANPQKEKEEEKEKEKEKNTCSICLEEQESEQKNNIATTPCGHAFCLSCLISHLKYNNSCPLCRAPIEENAKKIVTPISYDDGVMLLNHELTSLNIEQDIERFVQNAIEIAGNSQTDGSNVSSIVDDLMTMVANFGFNLLYDTVCHQMHGEENVDPEWQYEMYGSDSDSEGDEEDGDSESDEGDESESDSESDSEDGDSEDGDSDSDSEVWANKYQLPSVEIYSLDG